MHPTRITVVHAGNGVSDNFKESLLRKFNSPVGLYVYTTDIDFVDTPINFKAKSELVVFYSTPEIEESRISEVLAKWEQVYSVYSVWCTDQKKDHDKGDVVDERVSSIEVWNPEKFITTLSIVEKKVS